jgi:hypothetical protein
MGATLRHCIVKSPAEVSSRPQSTDGEFLVRRGNGYLLACHFSPSLLALIHEVKLSVNANLWGFSYFLHPKIMPYPLSLPYPILERARIFLDEARDLPFRKGRRHMLQLSRYQVSCLGMF